MKKQDDVKDEGPSLICSEFGCSNPWSVKIDANPKCSYHQWGRLPPHYDNIDFEFNKIGDKKDWARRILEREKRGMYVSKVAVQFAKEALKIDHE